MQKKYMSVIIFLLVFGANLLGCAAPVAGVADADVGDLPANLSVYDVSQVMAHNDVVLIDVREDYEYSAGHIDGAELIPLGQIPDRINEIPNNVPVILVCRSGNRSGQAYDYLSKQGFDNVHNMLDGMVAWSEAGFEIVK